MRPRPLVLVAAAVLALAPLVAVPAAAAPAPHSELLLTLREGTAQRSVTLSCHPGASGTHPNAREACAALAAAGGDFAALPSGEGVCTLHYAPVTATASGRWLDREVDYSREFANACMAAQSTQQVFAF